MQARYYDPVIGRFYSNDPVGFTNIHTFNRYGYANNNPYKYIDPDGREVKISGGLWFKAKTLYAIYLTKSGRALYNKLDKSKYTVKIVEGSSNVTFFDSSENAGNGVGTGSTIYFDSSSSEGGADDSGSTDSSLAANLAHEMGHALDGVTGTEDQTDLGSKSEKQESGTTPSYEKTALAEENKVRKEQGLEKRSTYVD